MKSSRLFFQANVFSKKTGMTLIEIMVVLSVFVILSTITFGAMRAYDVSTTMSITKSRLSAQANLALNRMRDELSTSKASIVSVGTPNVDIYFQIPTGLDGEQNIRWGDGIDFDINPGDFRVGYYITDASTTPSNQLIRHLPDQSPEVMETIASYISSLQFALSGNSVSIDIIASRGAQRGYIPALSIDLSTQVDFRN